MSEPSPYTNTPRLAVCATENVLPLAESTENTDMHLLFENPLCVARRFISGHANTNCFIVQRLVEVCITKQADTLHLTGSVIWRESDRTLSEQFKISMRQGLFVTKDDPRQYVK